jgi:hypothetical protein
MDKTIKRTLVWTGSGLLLLLILIIINQLNQISIAASVIHPFFGRIVTVFLAILFGVLFLVPAIGFMNLRRPLELPDENDEEAYNSYLLTLKKRFSKNKYLLSAEYVFDENKELKSQIDGALDILNKETIKVINEASSAVFLTTAISQSGVLDGLFVLSNLSRMVWKISHIYNQRPNTKEILYLYANIAATVLMAREIEDLALLDEQLEPVISSLIGGTLSTFVPGATAVANLIVNSVIEGSANAFLTLRVGAMARRYSAATTKVDKRVVRRLATFEACTLLGVVVQQNSVSVVKAFASASKKATLDRTVDKIKEGANKTGSFMKDIFTKNSKKNDE